MEQATVDFLNDVRYMSKEEYLAEMSALRKSWKKVYEKVSKNIRALKYGEKLIGQNDISWRAVDINELTPYLSYDDDTFCQEEKLSIAKEITALTNEMHEFSKSAGRLQAIRVVSSHVATFMLAEYHDQRRYLKNCARYSWTMNKMMEETNRRFA